MESYISNIKGYKAGDTIFGYDKQASTIPMRNKFTILPGMYKLVQYRNGSGMPMVDVFLGVERTSLCHIYTKMTCRNKKVIILVDTAGINKLTKKSVKSFPRCVIDHLCAVAENTDYDRKAVIHENVSNIKDEYPYAPDIDPFLTTIDNSEYDSFIDEMRKGMGSLVDVCYESMAADDDDDNSLLNQIIRKSPRVDPLSELYTIYAHNCYDCAADPYTFSDYPANIHDLLICSDVLVRNDALLLGLLDACLNGMYPDDYHRHDYSLSAFVSDYHKGNCMKTVSDIFNFKLDDYKALKEFDGELLKLCYSFMTNINSQFSCRYILLNKSCPVHIRRLVNQICVTEALASTPTVCEIFKSCIDELFITIVMADSDRHEYFIDLTMVPLICHGLRYL